MKFIERKYIKIVALALSLPGSIFFLAWFLLGLAEKKIISSLTAVLIIIIYVTNTIFLIARHVWKNNN